MDTAIALIAAVFAAIGIIVSVRAERAARISANEAKRANDLQAQSIDESKQAKLQFVDGQRALLIDMEDGQALQFRVPVTNKGLGNALNLRFVMSFGYATFGSRDYPGDNRERLDSMETIELRCTVPPSGFRYHIGKSILQLHWDDLYKDNQMIQREAILTGSHESGEYIFELR